MRKTVYDFISGIVTRGKSHREVAADCDQFSLMTLVPQPYKKAIDAIALHHGWSRLAGAQPQQSRRPARRRAQEGAPRTMLLCGTSILSQVLFEEVCVPHLISGAIDA